MGKNRDSHLPQLARAAAPPDLAGLARVPRLEVARALGGPALAVVGGAPVVAVEREFICYFFVFARPREPRRRFWSASIVYFEMGGKKKKKDNWRRLPPLRFDLSPSQGTGYDALYLDGASSAENSAHKPRSTGEVFEWASVSDGNLAGTRKKKAQQPTLSLVVPCAFVVGHARALVAALLGRGRVGLLDRGAAEVEVAVVAVIFFFEVEIEG